MKMRGLPAAEKLETSSY